MKKFSIQIIVILMLIIFTASFGFAQVTVSGSNGANGDYSTLKGAFDIINSNSQTGNNIVITITASTTETATASLTGAAGMWSSLLIYPTTSGLSISGNFSGNLIDINEADNVTIDGRVNQSGSKNLVIQTSNGVAIQFINSAENNIVKYCVLKGTSQTLGVVFFSNSASGNGNDNNLIDNCDITNGGTRPLNGILSDGGSSGTITNSGNIVSNNNFFNLMHLTSECNGIYIYRLSTEWTISGNSFYEENDLTFTTTPNYKCHIKMNNATGVVTVTGNYIGGKAPLCGGSAIKLTASGIGTTYSPLNIVASPTEISNITNNTITNIDYSGSTYFIPFTNSISIKGNITGNIIGSSTTNDAIKISSTSTGMPPMVYALLVTLPAIGGQNHPVYVLNNTVGGFTLSNSVSADYVININAIAISSGVANSYCYVENNIVGSTTVPNSIRCINTGATGNRAQSLIGINYSSESSICIRNNTIANLTNNFTINGTSATRSQTIGIRASNSDGNWEISNNTIRDLKCASANNQKADRASVIGIAFRIRNGTTHSIFGNTVYNLENIGTTVSDVTVTGIYFEGSPYASNSDVYGNFVHSLKINPLNTSTTATISGLEINNFHLVPGTETSIRNFYNNVISVGTGFNNDCFVFGIYEYGAQARTNNVYFNTVYVSGTPNGNQNSYALYVTGSSTSVVRNFRNNIFVNARSRTGGTGQHYAASYANTYGLTVDYNDYFVSGTGAMLGYNGGDISSLPIVAGQDANSLNTNPLFESAGSTTATDYKPTVTLSGISISGITTDFLGNTRGPTPIMGAFEICTPPAQPTEIAGNSSPCSGTTGLVYSVTNVAGVTYNWTVPIGWSITEGVGTNSITVTAGSTSGDITVTPDNGCGNPEGRTLAVTPLTVPAQPSEITGDASPCSGTANLTYSVTNVTGVSYAWTVPAGWSITAGTGTNSITVTAGSSSGNISVTPSNGCGNGTGQSLAVNPGLAPSVTGNPSNSTIGEGGNTSFTVTASGAGLSYQWQVSTDGGTNFNNITAAGTNPEYSGWTTSTLQLNSAILGNSGYLYRCVVTGTCNPNTATSNSAVLTVNASPAITTHPSNSIVCDGDNTNFIVAASGSGLSYQWQVSIDGGVNYNNITAAGSNPTYGNWTTSELTLTGVDVLNNGYLFKCIVDDGISTPSVSNSAELTVNEVPAQPSDITGDDLVCQGATGLNYSVTNVAGVTYNWTLPAGWSITAGSGTNSITVTAGSTGDITVTPSNSCGNGAAQNIAVSTTAVPEQPSAITGTLFPCYDATEIYSVTNIVGVSYEWTVPDGITITSGNGTNEITVSVASGAISGDITVTPSNDCGIGISQTLAVTPSGPPSLPFWFTSWHYVCHNSTGMTYSVYNVPGQSYAWTVPADWTITAGQGTSEITVNIGNQSGQVIVIPSNGCTSGPAAVLDVTTFQGVPDQTSEIIGNTTPCEDETGLIYSVENTPGYSYSWSTPSGWLVTAGYFTNSITVSAGTGSGDITVTATNSCGWGTTPRTLAVTAISSPEQPSEITGNTNPNLGETGLIYSVEYVAGVEYTWSVPTGWTITAGNGTNSITVTAGSSSGTIEVIPSNDCGVGISSTLDVNPLSIFEEESSYNIYPNPSNGNFTVEVDKVYTLEIIDLTGKIILSEELNVGQNIIKVEAKGVFLIKLTNMAENINLKLIIN